MEKRIRIDNLTNEDEEVLLNLSSSNNNRFNNDSDNNTIIDEQEEIAREYRAFQKFLESQQLNNNSKTPKNQNTDESFIQFQQFQQFQKLQQQQKLLKQQQQQQQQSYNQTKSSYPSHSSSLLSQQPLPPLLQSSSYSLNKSSYSQPQQQFSSYRNISSNNNSNNNYQYQNYIPNYQQQYKSEIDEINDQYRLQQQYNSSLNERYEVINNLNINNTINNKPILKKIFTINNQPNYNNNIQLSSPQSPQSPRQPKSPTQQQLSTYNQNNNNQQSPRQPRSPSQQSSIFNQNNCNNILHQNHHFQKQLQNQQQYQQNQQQQQRFSIINSMNNKYETESSEDDIDDSSSTTSSINYNSINSSNNSSNNNSYQKYLLFNKEPIIDDEENNNKTNTNNHNNNGNSNNNNNNNNEDIEEDENEEDNKNNFKNQKRILNFSNNNSGEVGKNLLSLVEYNLDKKKQIIEGKNSKRNKEEEELEEKRLKYQQRISSNSKLENEERIEEFSNIFKKLKEEDSFNDIINFTEREIIIILNATRHYFSDFKKNKFNNLDKLLLYMAFSKTGSSTTHISKMFSVTQVTISRVVQKIRTVVEKMSKKDLPFQIFRPSVSKFSKNENPHHIGLVVDCITIKTTIADSKKDEYFDEDSNICGIKFMVAVQFTEPHYSIFVSQPYLGSTPQQVIFNQEKYNLKSYLKKVEPDEFDTNLPFKEWAVLTFYNADLEDTSKEDPELRVINVNENRKVLIEHKKIIDRYLGRLYGLWGITGNYRLDQRYIEIDFKNLIWLTNVHIQKKDLDQEDLTFFHQFKKTLSESDKRITKSKKKEKKRKLEEAKKKELNYNFELNENDSESESEYTFINKKNKMNSIKQVQQQQQNQNQLINSNNSTINNSIRASLNNFNSSFIGYSKKNNSEDELDNNNNTLFKNHQTHNNSNNNNSINKYSDDEYSSDDSNNNSNNSNNNRMQQQKQNNFNIFNMSPEISSNSRSNQSQIERKKNY